jgi:hypothetical protein
LARAELAEVCDGPAQPLLDGHARLPAEAAPGNADVRLADLGVVHRERPELDRDVVADQRPDGLGKLQYGHLAGVADIDGVADAGVECLTYDQQFSLVWVAVGAPWGVRVLGSDAVLGRGCVGTTNGGTGCWTTQPDGGRVFEVPPGVRLFPRLLVGDTASGCAVTELNGVQCWGDNRWGQLGRDGPASPRAVDLALAEPIQSISMSAEHVCVLTSSGAVKCWGDNHNAQLGSRPLLRSEAFVKVPY